MIKVDNAIIMAAGFSSRFVPLCYEKPKGLMIVKQEVLIERQIKQLQEVCISDITIVTGYLHEQFNYLKDKFKVDIIYNDQYQKRNNNSSLYLVRHLLKNTYICSADNYFSENVFSKIEEHPYYSCVYEKGHTNEWCVKTNNDGYINEVTIGGNDSFYMLGHVLFDEEFSNRFKEILTNEYDLVETYDKLWEKIYMSHLDVLKLKVKEYANNVVFEFDSLDELREFDSSYYDLDFSILRNIEKILDVKQKDISNFSPVLKGLMNLSFKFNVGDKCYIYRHPGKATKGLINRISEKHSQLKAKELGLDETLIYFDDEGWKISEYFEDCVDFDYHNKEHVREAISIFKVLHQAQLKSNYEFGMWDKITNYIKEISKTGRFVFDDFDEVYNKIQDIYDIVSNEGYPKILCHMDAYDTNFLLTKDKMYLIDWEFSGSEDPACDLGTFICCSDYSIDESLQVLKDYLGNTDKKTYRHYIGYIAVTSFQWLTWALYKESIGDDVGDFVDVYYGHTMSFIEKYRK